MLDLICLTRPLQTSHDAPSTGTDATSRTGLDPCAREEWQRGRIHLPGACQHRKVLQGTFCLDSLRSILVCMYSVMLV